MNLITLADVVGDYRLFNYSHNQIVDMMRFAQQHGWKPKEEKQDGRSSK